LVLGFQSLFRASVNLGPETGGRRALCEIWAISKHFRISAAFGAPLLFRAQRLHWIDPRRLSCREVAGGERDKKEEQGHINISTEERGVGRIDGASLCNGWF
jgi:hypothetical protein